MSEEEFDFRKILQQSYEAMLAAEYKVKRQQFFLPPKLAHEASKEGLITYNTRADCHALTDKALAIAGMIGVRGDAEIHISRNL